MSEMPAQPIPPSRRAILVPFFFWLMAALILSVTDVLVSLPRPALQAIIVFLTLATIAAWRLFPALRAGTAVIDLRWFLAFHAIRLPLGLTFLLTHALPRQFTQPAGYGDALVGLSALILLFLINPRSASRPSRTSAFWRWNTLGLLDIAGVVINAARIGLADPESMRSLATFPFSLLPTFFVPLVIASHVVIFARLTTARHERRAQP